MALDIDPVETAEELRADSEKDASHEKLNGFVAITVAILATFLGICNVKDDNVVQAMLAAQAEVIDQWTFFQARNIREEVMLATVEQLTLERAAAPTRPRSPLSTRRSNYSDDGEEPEHQEGRAEGAGRSAQVRYDKLNYKDDQFDLAEAAIAIAIALLAITALTHVWWLFWLSMMPSAFGMAIGRPACSACRSTRLPDPPADVAASRRGRGPGEGALHPLKSPA